MAGTISEEDIQKVREASDLVAIIGERTPVKQRGRDFWCCCPLHNEKTPSFKIDPVLQLWHCFGCNEGGDVFGFLMKTEDLSFPEAVRKLAERAHIDIADTGGRGGVPSSKKARLKAVCEATATFYHTQLMRNPDADAAAARSYLAGRGLGGDVPRRWRLGFAPGRGQLVRHLSAQGFSAEEMVEANVAMKDRGGKLRDRFFNRVMFPIGDAQGECIAFGGRVIGKGEPKYLNSQETPGVPQVAGALRAGPREGGHGRHGRGRGGGGLHRRHRAARGRHRQRGGHARHRAHHAPHTPARAPRAAQDRVPVRRRRGGAARRRPRARLHRRFHDAGGGAGEGGAGRRHAAGQPGPGGVRGRARGRRAARAHRARPAPAEVRHRAPPGRARPGQRRGSLARARRRARGARAHQGLAPGEGLRRADSQSLPRTRGGRARAAGAPGAAAARRRGGRRRAGPCGRARRRRAPSRGRPGGRARAARGRRAARGGCPSPRRTGAASSASS